MPASAFDLALEQTKLGNYREAYPLLQKALVEIEAAHGAGAPETALCLLKLGYVADRLSKSSEARTALERAHAIREAHFGPEHPETAECLHELGSLLFDMDQIDDGMTLTQRAYELRRRALGEDHPDTLESLKNDQLQRAVAARRNTAFDKAAKQAIQAECVAALEAALVTSERLYGDGNMITARLLNAVALHASSERKSQLSARALELTRKLMGEDHPETASRIINHALNTYAETPDRAVEDMLHAITIHERAYGVENLYTGLALLSLGDVYKALKQPDEARPYYERALICMVRSGGPRHSLTQRVLTALSSSDALQGGRPAPDTMTVYTILRGLFPQTFENSPGAFLMGRANPVEAEAALIQYVDRLDAKYHTAPLTETQYADLKEAERLHEAAKQAYTDGKYEAAREQLEQALHLREGVLGVNDFGHVPLLETLIRIQQRLGRFTAVLPLQERIAALHRENLGAMNPLTTMAQQRVYERASEDTQPDKAQAAFQQLADAFQKMGGADNPMLNMLSRLQDLRTTQQAARGGSRESLAERQERTLKMLSPKQIAALDGIEKIDWHGLHHAYGPADDIPMYLKLLMSEDRDVENSAWQYIYSSIYHQGSLYPATAAAVPFFLNMLRAGEPPHRADVLMFCMNMIDPDFMPDEIDGRFREAEPPTDPSEMAAERAARAGLPIYLEILPEVVHTYDPADEPEANALGILLRLLASFRNIPAAVPTIVAALKAVSTSDAAATKLIARALRRLEGSPK